MDTVQLPIGLIDAVSNAASEEELFQATADWLPVAMASSRATIARKQGNSLFVKSLSSRSIFDTDLVLPLDGSGFASKAIAHGGPMMISDLRLQGLPLHKPLVDAGYRSLALAPLMSGDLCLGTVNVLHKTPNHFSESDGVRLSCIARWIASRLRVLEQLDEIRHLSQTDMLTGAANRRAFIERAADMYWAFRNGGAPFSLLMIDLDHFKSVNDTYGHAAGDAVLANLAAQFRSAIRKTDLLARLGGEEFAVLLGNSDAAEARKVAERIRTVAEQQIVAYGDESLRVTLSIGITEITGRDSSIDRLMTRADEALYKAKKAGRNCVVLAA
ncbi:diguanylate cyclase [Primorskyibacter sp. 2E107]|uniref:sensor domain-containing diguanylate cyclase n=1 Tax=Primorskyibacter sp. 2E107 TaxID=3403458 RepID=UPI003AF4B430